MFPCVLSNSNYNHTILLRCFDSLTQESSFFVSRPKLAHTVAPPTPLFVLHFTYSLIGMCQLVVRLFFTLDSSRDYSRGCFEFRSVKAMEFISLLRSLLVIPQMFNYSFNYMLIQLLNLISVQISLKKHCRIFHHH